MSGGCSIAVVCGCVLSATPPRVRSAALETPSSRLTACVGKKTGAMNFAVGIASVARFVSLAGIGVLSGRL